MEDLLCTLDTEKDKKKTAMLLHFAEVYDIFGKLYRRGKGNIREYPPPEDFIKISISYEILKLRQILQRVWVHITPEYKR